MAKNIEKPIFWGYSEDSINRLNNFLEALGEESESHLDVNCCYNCFAYPRNYIDNSLPPSVQVGVYDDEGIIIPNSILYRKNKVHTKLPDKFSPLDKFDFDVVDNVLYGGLMTSHHGHMITESLSRVWFRNSCTTPILYLGESNLNNNILKIYYMMYGYIPEIIIPKKPLLIKKIYFPTPSFIESKFMSPIHLAQLRIEKKYKIFSGKKAIYLSRRLLANDSRAVKNEQLLEDVFLKMGIKIVHPQLLSLDEQIAEVQNADLLIGPIGSALHNILISNFDGKIIYLTNSLPHLNFPLIDKVLKLQSIYINCINSTSNGKEFTYNIEMIEDIVSSQI